jgi:hypothetical protein
MQYTLSPPCTPVQCSYRTSQERQTLFVFNNFIDVSDELAVSIFRLEVSFEAVCYDAIGNDQFFLRNFSFHLQAKKVCFYFYAVVNFL